MNQNPLEAADFSISYEAWPAATDGSSVERLAVPGGAVMVKSQVTP